jgi:hypothetical protein
MSSFDEFLTKATASGPEQLIPGCVLAAYKDGMVQRPDKPHETILRKYRI